MSHSKLKGRSAFPFETIGVAVAFSPRLEAILGEAKILSESFGSELLLIHIGEHSKTKESKLEEMMNDLQINKTKTKIIWKQGNAVTTLLDVCKENAVDLLVMGALRKENVLKFYLGSLARKISRRAKCSVLLLTEPKKEGSRFKKIMVNGVENQKTVHSINTAVYFAKKMKGKEMTVATEVFESGLSMTIADESTVGETSKRKKANAEEEMSKIHAIVTKCTNEGDIEITEKLIKGKPGFAIRQYAETKKTDLLVINSPDVKYGIFDRIFTHDMEYILENIPCNVLIVHSRIS